jgi:hypothetical protein
MVKIHIYGRWNKICYLSYSKNPVYI